MYFFPSRRDGLMWGANRRIEINPMDTSCSVTSDYHVDFSLFDVVEAYIYLIVKIEPARVFFTLVNETSCRCRSGWVSQRWLPARWPSRPP